MANINGTNLASPVVPFTTDDTYATHYAKYGNGSWQEVATTADRDAISSNRREAGMAVFVTSENKLYTLGTDLTTWTLFETGKIDTISVNTVQQAIVNKNVDITVPTKISDLTDDTATNPVDKADTLTNLTAATNELNAIHNSGVTNADLQKLHDITAESDEINVLDGLNTTTAELNELHNGTAVKNDFIKLHNLTSTATELNYTEGVTSNIQTQLNSKQPNLTAGSNIQINSSTNTISAADTKYSAGSGLDLTGTSFSVDTNEIQEKLTAGSNIQINNNVISATDTTYSAGNGLTLTGTSFSVNTVDNVTSSSTTDPLSAKMGKELQDQIDNLESRGRYLSQWNSATGLPVTNPTTSPYTYHTGDYYIVSNISTGTNYRPNGSTYTTGVPSTTVETEAVMVDDTYIYDGSIWVLQANASRTVTFANLAGQPYDNTNLATALNEKLTKNNNITGATKTKITYDEKGLVTAGSDLIASDIPSLTLSKISDITATAAEVNVLDGITATTTELNYVDGVTSNVQTQLNSKVDKTSTAKQIYATSTANTQTTLTYDTTSTANYIVQRDANGQVIVPTTPTINTHATSKKYVDDGLDNKPDTTSLSTVAFSGSYEDLNDLPDIQQSDWNQTDNTKIDYIKNKPTIPTTTSSVTSGSTAALTSGGAYTNLVSNVTVTDSKTINVTKNGTTTSTTIDNVENAVNASNAVTATTAVTANKLGSTTVGSTTKPIYLQNGVATALNYTIQTSVPSGAVFTDTTYSAGNGLDLNRTQFYVNTGDIQEKLTAGDNITINKDTLLPSGLTQLEYIEANGQQFFNTNFTYESGDEIETEFYIDYINVSSRDAYLISTGSNWSSSNRLGLGINENNYTCVFNDIDSSNGALRPVTSTNDSINKWLISGTTCLIPDLDLTLDLSSATYTSAIGNLIFFKDANNLVPGKLKSYIQKRSGSIIHYLIPATDGTGIGMFDLVTGRFYISESGVSFVAGSETQSLIISATDTKYTAGNGLTLSGTQFSVNTNTIQSKLTAGSNISISGSTISATDTTYSAGTGINIDSNNEISNTFTKISDLTDDTSTNPIDKADTLTGLTATASELNVLDGITATTTELNYTDGVTSNIQTQLNSKQANLTAGTNIQINNNTISATDTTYTAGTNVQITGTTISATDTTYSAGTGINIDANNEISADQELYWCTYGTTTFAQIQAALSENKLPVMMYSNNLFTYLSYSNSNYNFSAYYLNSVYHIEVTPQSVWRLYTKTCEITDNKITSITSSSTDTQYPSAKAVYDYHDNTKQDTLTAGSNITISNNTISATDTTYSAGNGLTLTGTSFSANVVDNVTSTSTTNALSANMGKELQDQIDNLESRGRYLSQWNCTTGLPLTNPTTSPYTYHTGDYYVVSTVGTTNYRPTGSTYTIGTASTVVETEAVMQDDTYIYDGTNWILQANATRTVAFANISGQPTDNTNLASALNDKVTKNNDITAGTHTKITYDSKGLVTSGTDLSASDIPSLTLSKISDVTATASEVNVLDGITATTTELNYTDGVTSNLQTQLNSKQPTLTAGTNITISNNTISATDTTYSAGTGLNLTNNTLSINQSTNVAKATNSLYGLVKPDNSTITISDGVISASPATSVDNTTIDKNSDDEIETIGIIEQNANSALYKWVGTLAEYNAMTSHSNNTEYIITDDNVGGTSVYTKSEVDNLLDAKQNTLTAGTGITINASNVISNTQILPTKLSDLTDDTSTNPVDKADTLTGLTATTTELNYTDGVTSNIQTQLNAKQATLVSGTNIKTINNNSILGSGNISVDSLPSQSGQSGKYLTTNGTTASWGTISSSLSGLSDVSISSPIANQFLRYNGTNWVNESSIQLVSQLPASPTAGVLYLIPEA